MATKKSNADQLTFPGYEKHEFYSFVCIINPFRNSLEDDYEWKIGYWNAVIGHLSKRLSSSEMSQGMEFGLQVIRQMERLRGCQK